MMRLPFFVLLSTLLLAGCGGLESDLSCTEDGVCEDEVLDETLDALCPSVVSPDSLPDSRTCSTAYNKDTSVYAINASTDKDWTYVTNNGFSNLSKFVVKAQSIPIVCSVHDGAGVQLATASVSAFGTCSVSWNASGYNKYYLQIAMSGASAPPGSVFGEQLSKYWQMRPVDDEFANVLTTPFGLHLNPYGYTKMKGGVQNSNDVDALSFRASGTITRVGRIHQITLTGSGTSALGVSRVSVYDSNGALVGSSDSVSGQASLTVALNVGPTYYVLVQGRQLDTGDFNLEVQAEY